MELTGAALRRSPLPSASPVAARRRRARARVACVGGAEEGHLRYYEPPAPRRKAVEAVARDLARIRAMGIVAGDAPKEKLLSEATDLLLQELDQMKDEEREIKAAQEEEKAAMKALKKQLKEAAAAMSCGEEGYSSESSESDCGEEPTVGAEQGTVVVASAAAVVPKVAASGVSTVSGAECEKAMKKMEKERMKAVKKMEKEQMKAVKKMEKEQKKAAKMATKAERKMAMAATNNGCMDEDNDSSCSSESSDDSECEGQVVRMSRCATIARPETPSPTAVFPVIVPQIPASLAPAPSQASEPATAIQVTGISSSLAVAETPKTSRIEVCMGGKCKKSGALALLQEFEKAVGTGGGAAAVGCKCLGKCGLGPNVRLRRSEVLGEGSAAKGTNPLCIGVGLENVGAIVAGLFGDGGPGMAPNN